MSPPEGICSVCGAVHNVSLDHAGWGWICGKCFDLPPEIIERGQEVRERLRQNNVCEAHGSVKQDCEHKN